MTIEKLLDFQNKRIELQHEVDRTEKEFLEALGGDRVEREEALKNYIEALDLYTHFVRVYGMVK